MNELKIILGTIILWEIGRFIVNNWIIPAYNKLLEEDEEDAEHN